MAKGSYFRKIDVELLEKRLKEKCPINKIAEEMGCSRTAIYKYRKSRGLEKEAAAFKLDPGWLREQKAQGRSDADIAQEFGVSQATVTNLRNRHGISGLPHLRPREIADLDPDWLREQKVLGRSDDEIAKELGCSARTVLRRRREWGIKAY